MVDFNVLLKDVIDDLRAAAPHMKNGMSRTVLATRAQQCEEALAELEQSSVSGSACPSRELFDLANRIVRGEEAGTHLDKRHVPGIRAAAQYIRDSREQSLSAEEPDCQP